MIYDSLSIKVYFSGSSTVAITNANFSRRYSMYYLTTEIQEVICVGKYYRYRFFK